MIILLGSFFSQSGEYEVYRRRYSSYSKKCVGGGGRLTYTAAMHIKYILIHK